MKKLLIAVGLISVMSLSSCSIFVHTKHHAAGASVGSIQTPKNPVSDKTHS